MSPSRLEDGKKQKSSVEYMKWTAYNICNKWNNFSFSVFHSLLFQNYFNNDFSIISQKCINFVLFQTDSIDSEFQKIKVLQKMYPIDKCFALLRREFQHHFLLILYGLSLNYFCIDWYY